MKKVLITGATGFVGSWVVQEMLDHDIEVVAVVREDSANIERLSDKAVSIVRCSLENYERLPDLIADRDMDAVYHFAWQGVSDRDIRSSDIQIQNVEATLKLIEVMPELRCATFVGAGSLHEIESFYEMQEDKRIDNLGYMYKAAKLSAHWMGKALAGSKDIRFFWPVISNTYGVGEKSGRLVNTVIRQMMDGNVPALSAGNQNYDFVYISDVAKAFRLIGEKGVDGANYLIGSGQVRPLREYLRIAQDVTNRLCNSDIPLGLGQRTSDVVFLPEEVFDITNLVEDTGFQITVTFEEGVEQTAKWIKQSML